MIVVLLNNWKMCIFSGVIAENKYLGYFWYLIIKEYTKYRKWEGYIYY